VLARCEILVQSSDHAAAEHGDSVAVSRMEWQSDRYVAEVHAELPGQASLSIKVNGADIAASPWVLIVLVRLRPTT
jgi:hypothetical protein